MIIARAIISIALTIGSPVSILDILRYFFGF